MAETQPILQPVTETPKYRCVMVCQHTSCQRNGSAQVLQAFQEQKTLGVTVKPSGCMGQCSSGPTVRITPDEIWYCRVQTNDVPTIIKQHLIGGEPVASKLHPRIHLSW